MILVGAGGVITNLYPRDPPHLFLHCYDVKMLTFLERQGGVAWVHKFFWGRSLPGTHKESGANVPEFLVMRILGIRQIGMWWYGGGSCLFVPTRPPLW